MFDWQSLGSMAYRLSEQGLQAFKQQMPTMFSTNVHNGAIPGYLPHVGYPWPVPPGVPAPQPSSEPPRPGGYPYGMPYGAMYGAAPWMPGGMPARGGQPMPPEVLPEVPPEKTGFFRRKKKSSGALETLPAIPMDKIGMFHRKKQPVGPPAPLRPALPQTREQMSKRVQGRLLNISITPDEIRQNPQAERTTLFTRQFVAQPWNYKNHLDPFGEHSL